MNYRDVLSGLVVTLVMAACPVAAETLRIAPFQADATPLLGSPVAYVAARSITDPLSARGIVILGAGQPIVLCAVDWIGIGNGGHDAWREGLAKAAGTTRDRVTVHTLHQHDGPRCDFTAEELLAAHGLRGTRYDTPFAQRVIESTAAAVRGNVQILHMPGELFVEYQLAAQKLRPENVVCMAAYGDYGTGYIGTAIAYSQGGYETQPSSSNTPPEAEEVLLAAMRKLLQTP